MTYNKYSSIVRNRGAYIDYIDRKHYRTKGGDIIYYIDYTNKNEYIIIPDKYDFDFNSSPCWGHCIVDRDEFMIGLVHDRLFDKDCVLYIKDLKNLSPRFKRLMKHGYGIKLLNEGKCEFLYNRKFADKIWYEGAKEEAREIERVNKDTKAFLGYLAIRIGGAKNFRK